MKNCEICDKEFASKEALQMHNQAKHQTSSTEGLSKQERRELREEEKEKLREKSRRIKLSKQILGYGSLAGILVLLIYWFAANADFETYTQGQVHWHAGLSISICGENVPLPKPTGGSVHGQSFIGTPLMHLHNEPLIHLEGVIRDEEDITLGKFMEVIGLNFKNDQLLDYKNGDACPDGNTGKVMLLVNGVSSQELVNKVIADGEEYQLRFG